MSTAARRAYGFVAWLLPPVGVISTQAMALLGLLGALRLFAIREVRQALPAEIASPLGLLLVLAVAWMLAACIWTIHPGKALYLAARIGVVFLGGLAFLAPARTMDAADVRRAQLTFCKAALVHVVDRRRHQPAAAQSDGKAEMDPVGGLEAIGAEIPVHGRDALRGQGAHVQTGAFGQHMQVQLINDGPVTVMLEV